MIEALSYRDFLYPLNVFMHILIAEEGRVEYLHYGLFADADESITTAQERSTELLLARLPAPPSRLLDVGAGVGTTLARLTALGYDAVSITPDDHQVALVKSRYGETVRVLCERFEDHIEPADVILFQESSQYIDSDALFLRARALSGHVIVLDEFSQRPIDMPGALHSLDGFLDAARRNGYRLSENVDLSAQAAPTIGYFMERIPHHRERLQADLGLTNEQVAELVTSGERYRELYRDGTYGYRLLQFHRGDG